MIRCQKSKLYKAFLAYLRSKMSRYYSKNFVRGLTEIPSVVLAKIRPWYSPKSVRGTRQNPSVVHPKIRPALTSKLIQDWTQNRTIRWRKNAAGLFFGLFLKSARNKIATTAPPPSPGSIFARPEMSAAR